ncbi:bifunctional tetrahydrofolate synthase/dihydrofolate synthase [Acinetobacter puyangensis]|uniref:bifunctional tetrahydrofolate synthase/dihydrofolate synthase n=1 Tax=Acinetobacter puyangensis TaxID=1096779 RepID=UPI003A4D58E3
MSHTTPTASDSLKTWLDYWTTVHVTAIDLGLERVLPVAHALNILRPKAKVFTVAGTNGKGSTTTTLAAILNAAGYQVGLYQSPHIFYFNERVRINGIEVADDVLVDAFVQIEQARQQCDLTLSFFEATTLAAFYIFTQQQCDVWVLEVGLGGRLDVVNIIDPNVAVITNIGLDHVDWLGDSIEKIAFEKAGIIRPNIPVVFAGAQTLPQAIADKIEQCQATLYQYQKDYFFELTDEHWYLATPALTMAFAHGQLAHINQSAALMAVLASGLNISHDQMMQGVQAAQLAGRFETRQYQNRHLVLDVAHNPHGVRFLKQQLSRYLQLHPEITQVNAVFSMLDDKDIQGVVQLLTTIVKEWYIAPLNVARACTITRLQDELQGQEFFVSESIQQSFEQALQRSSSQHLILVCGSFHTLEAVWEYLLNGDE